MVTHKAVLRKPLTSRGQAILAEEHYTLAKKERPKLLASIQAAAAEGDRSENAEYIYGKKKLRELDYRIRYLNRLLDKAQVIHPKPLDRINFGTYFSILDSQGEQKTWIIVGEGETSFYQGGISWKSIMGRALLGKQVGDIVYVKRPKGEIEIEIVEINPPTGQEVS